MRVGLGAVSCGGLVLHGDGIARMGGMVGGWWVGCATDVSSGVVKILGMLDMDVGGELWYE